VNDDGRAVPPGEPENGRDDVRERVLVLARHTLTRVALPSTALLAVYELVRDARDWPWVVFQLGMVCAGTAVLVRAREERTRGLALTAMMFGESLAALAHYGPTLGTGIFFAATMLLTAFFEGRRRVAAVLGALALGFCVVAGLATLGVHEPSALAPPLPVWIRMGASTFITLGVCTGFMVYVNEAHAHALERAHAARLREIEAQRQRDRMAQARESAQRLEALGRLAGGVAHDVNNALAVIRANLELLPGTSGAERDEITAEASRGVDRAAATARQLLAFARQSESRGATPSPAEHLAELVVATRRILPESITLSFEGTSTHAIPLTTAALDQIILNLVLNARDALPDGGPIQIACRDEGSDAIIEVRDDGVGMSPETRARAFEPFFTTKGDGGMGLGLSMVWGLVERAGGQVELESSPGRGTTVRLRVPAVGATDRREAADAAQPLGPRSVLLVEDQPDMARALVRQLQRLGLVVEHVATVADAAARLEAGGLDVLFTDGRLPDGSVAPLVIAHRRNRPDGAVVLCSGYLEELDDVVGAAGGVVRLQKPFSAPELAEALARAAEAGAREGLRAAEHAAPRATA
jgi:signal transduction histidine kinase/ActR/RegA family two-component response regulator